MPSLAMIDVRRDFVTRTAEIRNYLNFANEINEGALILNFTAVSALSVADATAWGKIIRASCFLLIYNLVESTMKSAIAAIFEDLQNKSIEFDLCREGIRRVVLNNFKALSPERALKDLLQIAIDVVIKTFDKNRVFSGNIDSRKIEKISEIYGFAKPQGLGHYLFMIKNHRNDLAHGDKSFDEIGREYDTTDIIRIFSGTENYLLSALSSIENYIDNQEYLMVNAISTTLIP